MNPVLKTPGELPLMVDDPKNVAMDGLEQWQVDGLSNPKDNDSVSLANTTLHTIDDIVENWLENLTDEQWKKIKRQNSLYSIPLPSDWIKVWRFILKEPQLRDSTRAARGGRALGSYTHLWNVWSEQCIAKYLDPMDRDLIDMVDAGLLYSEIGEIMLGRYGDAFWKPRKANSTTTPSQVVNNYLYQKLPNKIARGELTDLVRQRIKSK